MKWHFEDGRIMIDTMPKSFRKVTGTRFAAIMGLNKWNSEFKTWCEITGVYREPFVDTKYTRAGKVIEPKQAQYMKKHYFMRIVRPEDRFGKDYFKTTRGDFFPNDPHLGGMWDYLSIDEYGGINEVLEMKTTKRSEDWVDDIPEYYAMQAALYAYLLGVDNVCMVCSFLQEGDYDDPQMFVPSSGNTIIRDFKVSERYPNMSALVTRARLWWNTHVEKGISPEWDETVDKDILKELRKTVIDTNETEEQTLIAEANELVTEINRMKSDLKPMEDRLKVIMDWLKEQSQQKFRDGYKTVAFSGRDWTWNVSRSVSTKLDEDRMKADGIYDAYKTKEVESVRVTVQTNKEE